MSIFISQWIDADNADRHVRKTAEDILIEESQWTAHLCLQAQILPSPWSIHCTNYSKCISHLCNQQSRQQMWIKIHMKPSFSYKSVVEDGSSSSLMGYDGWEIWNKLRTACDHTQRLGVVLVLCGEEEDGNEMELNRWVAEPVRAIHIHTKVFLRNKKGYPVLSLVIQQFLSKFMQSKIHILIQGKPKLGSEYGHDDVDNSLYPYVQYIRHLEKTYRETIAGTFSEKFTEEYRDHLQAPLQPLMDNLESQTYDVFEKDPVKYNLYEDAMERAFNIKKNTLGGGAVTIRVAVLGAGRGPLVAAALRASATTNTNILVLAIEKNKNAVITLRNRIKNENWDNVTIIPTDMRFWNPTKEELVDIMVSELLGSWGDNELSPECLDGGQKCLKVDGISIPEEYTSFVAPISASKIWNSARSMPKGLDTPFVVKLAHCHYLHDHLPLFKFQHPRKNCHINDNSRYEVLSFKMPHNAIVHGFSGTFESVLFQDTPLMSINPQTHSPDMFSWFPLFLPLHTPVSVCKGDTLTLAVWRCVDERKVWYEWCLLDPIQTSIQNMNGSNYWIGL